VTVAIVAVARRGTEGTRREVEMCEGRAGWSFYLGPGQAGWAQRWAVVAASSTVQSGGGEQSDPCGTPRIGAAAAGAGTWNAAMDETFARDGPGWRMLVCEQTQTAMQERQEKERRDQWRRTRTRGRGARMRIEGRGAL